MPKKKKSEEPEEEVIEEAEPELEDELAVPEVVADIPSEEPILEAPQDNSGLVKIKVKVGTLGFEQGTFEKGSIITVSKERAAKFDPNSIEVLG